MNTRLIIIIIIIIVIVTVKWGLVAAGSQAQRIFEEAKYILIL